MEGFVLFIHILVSFLLIVIVLLQSGKAADLAGAFGGAGTQSTFGPRGTATLLSKMTTILAVMFMVTSLTLWIMAANKGGSESVLSPDDVQKQQTQTEQAKPEAGKVPDQPAAVNEKSPDGAVEKEGADTAKDKDKTSTGTSTETTGQDKEKEPGG